MKNFKTTSKAGMERKFHRLITQELAKRFPDVYQVLAFEAKQRIISDNEAVNTAINTWGIGSKKKPSHNLVTAVVHAHESRNEYAYGSPDATPNTKLARLLKKDAS